MTTKAPGSSASAAPQRRWRVGRWVMRNLPMIAKRLLVVILALVLPGFALDEAVQKQLEAILTRPRANELAFAVGNPNRPTELADEARKLPKEVLPILMAMVEKENGQRYDAAVGVLFHVMGDDRTVVEAALSAVRKGLLRSAAAGELDSSCVSASFIIWHGSRRDASVLIEARTVGTPVIARRLDGYLRTLQGLSDLRGDPYVLEHKLPSEKAAERTQNIVAERTQTTAVEPAAHPPSNVPEAKVAELKLNAPSPNKREILSWIVLGVTLFLVVGIVIFYHRRTNPDC